MKLKYIGLPNHNLLELIYIGVTSAGESLEVGKVYDIPEDDPILIRKLEDLCEAKIFEKVNNSKKEAKK